MFRSPSGTIWSVRLGHWPLILYRFRIQSGMVPRAPRSLIDTLFDAEHHGENRTYWTKSKLSMIFMQKWCVCWINKGYEDWRLIFLLQMACRNTLFTSRLFTLIWNLNPIVVLWTKQADTDVLFKPKSRRVIFWGLKICGDFQFKRIIEGKQGAIKMK